MRKVFGASVTNVVMLLSQDFHRLVGIAFVIAAPIAYFAMSPWLQDFAHRTEIRIGTLVLAGSLALVIAVLTVSTRAIKTALANPIESLRYE